MYDITLELKIRAMKLGHALALKPIGFFLFLSEFFNRLAHLWMDAVEAGRR